MSSTSGGSCPAPSENNQMAETNKLPRVITSNGHHAVEIADGIFIRWWNENGVWSVQIKSAAGLDVIGTHSETETVALH